MPALPYEGITLTVDDGNRGYRLFTDTGTAGANAIILELRRLQRLLFIDHFADHAFSRLQIRFSHV